MQDAAAAQRRTLQGLLRRAAGTAFGRAHGFDAIDGVEAFQRRVKLRRYEDFFAEWWQARMPVLDGASWPGPTRYLAKSSGTSGAPSKYIPVSPAILRSNRAAALDVLAWHLAAKPDSRVLGARNFLLGGSTALEPLGDGVQAGDLSGIAAATMPAWARRRSFPPPALALLPDWQDKMRRIAPLSLQQPVASLSGTPSWMLLFFEMLAELRPGARLDSLYPALELLVHGGVGFAPYRERFAWWLEGSAALTREVYAASEGFVAVADRGDGEGMRLILDRGLFFEFVRPSDLDGANPDRRWVATAEPGVEYALVLSSNAGAFGYVLGDTVRLVDLHPPRLLVTGRLGWSLSVAGEHLIGAELDAACAEAARMVGCGLVDYSAAPVPPDATDARGGHLFAVELDGPADAAAFAEALDAALARGNEDYAAHRGGGFGLRAPEVRLLPAGRFAQWMAARGRLGGQNKVPRVAADVAALREVLDENA